MKIHGTGPAKPIDSQALDAKARPTAGFPAAAEARATGATVGESFDAAKVEAIQAAIAAGTFKVNPDAVADKLIAGVADLLSREKP